MTTLIITQPLKDIHAGGAGSGNFHHAGIPGKRGGSQSNTGGSFQVGITSARPGKPTEQVRSDMQDFEGVMKETPVTNLSVHLGIGGWDGGAEDTFVTQYDGNGEGRKALARFARDHDQDAVLIQRYVSKRTPGAQPQNRMVFADDLGADDVKAIESALTDNGFGGWTWGRSGEKPLLMLTCVPQWGGNAAAHRKSFAELSTDLRNSGTRFSASEKSVLVEVMERGDYDVIIAENH